MDSLNRTLTSCFENILELKRNITIVSRRLGSDSNMKNLDRSFLIDQKTRLEYYVNELDEEYAKISEVFKSNKFNKFKKNLNPDVYNDYVKEHRDCYSFSIRTHNKIDKIESLLDKENTFHFGRTRTTKNTKRMVIDLKRLLTIM
jgi:hypothetical protein